ncbi:hypothetical protein GPECTOR_64g93 [Gonium pectorale]|uniref:5'-3' exonuclease domain-containing protein n=1 Tax=Gonium pectorale TaxID=33097 RepID=A0A150G4G7_GONPE|nr:hypothetical protein GPECTOR_64g93 [Gonium pectorale]|eukprot:KXZ44673.1 hypothetical protein GPECTOR_64g93 [Gonium pectorale]
MKLATKSGVPTSVTYGVLKTLQAAIRTVQPTALAVVFDPRGPTFRSAASLLDPSGTGPLAAAAARLSAAGRLDWQELANRLLAVDAVRRDVAAAATAAAAATPASYLQPSGSFLPPPPPLTSAAAFSAAALLPDGALPGGPAAAAATGGGLEELPPALQALQLPAALGPPAPAAAAPPSWASKKAAVALGLLTEALGPELAEALGLAAAAGAEGVAPPLLATPTYKAGRASHGSDFYTDFFNLQRLLGLMSVTPLIRPWLEADDLIGLLVKDAVRQGMAVRILSSDRDLMQLVDDAHGVAMLSPASPAALAAVDAGGGAGTAGGPSRSFPFSTLHEAQVVAALGVPPRLVADYKALTGDDSDCLPGVEGVGPKTAAQLLAAHGSLAGVHAAAASLTPKRRAALQAATAASHYTLAMARVLGAPGAPEAPPDVLPPDLMDRLSLRGFEPDLVGPALNELEMWSMAPAARRGAALWREFGGGRA